MTWRLEKPACNCQNPLWGATVTKKKRKKKLCMLSVTSVYMKDEPLRYRRCPSRWCSLVSSQTLAHPLALASLPNFFVCSCSLLRRLSSLSVWLLIIQRQTDLRSSAAAAKEKQERWRSSIRATGRTHEIQLLERIVSGEDCTSEFFFVSPSPVLYFHKKSAWLTRSTRTSVW